jgi:hypothetical protein
MIKILGRWLFGIQTLRKSALILLYPFPSFRRLLRIYVGVEGAMGGCDQHLVEQPTPQLLAPRASAIFADLSPVRLVSKKNTL